MTRFEQTSIEKARKEDMAKDKLLKMIKDEEADYVDIRFTDPRGKLQHVTIVADLVDEDFIEEGLHVRSARPSRDGSRSTSPT